MRRWPVLLGLVAILALALVGGWARVDAALAATATAAPRVALPALDVGAPWSSQVSVQNLSATATFAVLELYPEASDECSGGPPVAPLHVCLGQVAPGQSAVTDLASVPPGRYAGYVVAYSDCPAASGQPTNALLAAVVARQKTVGAGPRFAASAYTGVAPDPAAYNPAIERYAYFAPQVRAGLSDSQTTLSIQNTGDSCASVRVRFTAETFQDSSDCPATAATTDITVPPGGAVQLTPGQANLPVFFGSASLESTQPLAVAIDVTAAGERLMFTYTALPYTATPHYTLPALVNSAASVTPWQTSLKVQNSSAVNQTLVSERIFNRDGSPASSSLSQQICPASSRTIQVGDVSAAPDFVGAADVTGGPALAVLSNTGLEQYEGYPAIDVADAAARLGLPRLRREGVDEVVTLRSQVFVRNLDANRSVDVALALYGEDGKLVDTEVDTAPANGVAVFDLGSLRYLGLAWRGSGVVSAVGAPNAALAAVVLETSTQTGADRSRAYVGVGLPGAAPTPTATATATGAPTGTPTLPATATPTATPEPTPIVVELQAARYASGYVVSNDPNTNYFTAEDMYVGSDLKPWRPIRWLGGIQFDVSSLPDTARIVSAEVVLTGRNGVYLDNVPTMRWQMTLLDSSVDATWRSITYPGLLQAPALEPLVPALTPTDLGAGVTNTFRFTEAGRLRLQGRLTTTNLVSLRLSANEPNTGYRSIFDWNSGNAATGRPVLRVTYR